MKITTIQAQPDTQLNILQASNNHPPISFDDVFQNVTTIFAVPESGASQNISENTSNQAATFTISKNLEEIFQAASDSYQVPLNLLKAVAKAESDFNPNCTSNAGAMGIMQLMPSTASTLGVTDPYDPEQNIMGGAKLLSQLLNKYEGNIPYALAAYNAGSGNVDKYHGIPPFQETQNYVKKIMHYLGQDSITIPSNTNATSATVHATATNLPNDDYTIRATPMPYYNRHHS
ncbi:MAG: lytic transglycosylase domain-containing protein [Eubacteriales bacterium]|nr:lytic transglycosylase domain-containing protein [Eubacteriales bacterium]